MVNDDQNTDLEEEVSLSSLTELTFLRHGD